MKLIKTMLFSAIICSLFCISGVIAFADDESGQESDNTPAAEETQSTDNIVNNNQENNLKYNESQTRSTGLGLNKYSVNIDIGKRAFGYAFEEVMLQDETAVNAVSSNEEVATVSIGDLIYDNPEYVTIFGVNPGTATVTVTGISGRTAEIEVTILASYTLSSSKMTFNNYYDEWFQYDKCKYIDGSANDHDDSIYPKYGEIVKASSQNTKIVKLKEYKVYNSEYDYYEKYWKVFPVAAGSTTIVCTDLVGQKKKITLTVTNKFMNSWLYQATDINAARYGNTKVTGVSMPYATVKLRLAGKTYSAKANSKGKFSVKLSLFKKIGTKIKYTVSCGGGTYVVNKKIVKPKTEVYEIQDITKKSKKIWVTVHNVHKGDIIKVRIGKKTYKYKVKANAKKVKPKFKIKKSKAGKTITVKAYNRFNQKLDSFSSVVYYSLKLKKKMTKKQCKLVPGWEYPDEVYVNGNWTTWWYDKNYDGYADEAYLQFYKGKLRGWHY